MRTTVGTRYYDLIHRVYSTVSLTLPRMYCRSRYEVSSPMSGRKRKLRLTRKAFLYRETGGPPSFQAKKKFYGDDLVFPRGIMRSQRRQLDRALSFFTTDPGKYLTLGNIMILRLSSVFPHLH